MKNDESSLTDARRRLHLRAVDISIQVPSRSRAKKDSGHEGERGCDRSAERSPQPRAGRDQPVLSSLEDVPELGLRAPRRAVRQISLEEMKDAEEIIERILFLDG